jgi:uncharacterized membrane protein
MIHEPVPLLAFMFLVVAFARWLESRVSIIKKISSAVVCTLLGIALGNLGIIAQDGPIHAAINNFAVPYSIVLVILASNFGEMKKAGSRIVACFALAAVGSFVAALGAGVLFADALGPETWKLSGQFAGAFVGGGMNFVAVGRELETSPGLFSAALVADNLSTVPYMLAQVGLAAVLTPYFRSLPIWRRSPSVPAGAMAFEATAVQRGSDDTAAERPPSTELRDDPRKYWTESEISITDMAFLAALPLAFIWLGTYMSPLLPGFPQVLWLTTFAIIAAQFPVTRRLRGASVGSYFALHLFFIAIGAGSVISEVVKAGPMLFVYMTVILAIHVVVVYGTGWLLGYDMPNISVASQAAVGGPGSALALAMAMSWQTLVTPGIIVGILGYAVGNYIGFACAYLVRWLT